MTHDELLATIKAMTPEERASILALLESLREADEANLPRDDRGDWYGHEQK